MSINTGGPAFPYETKPSRHEIREGAAPKQLPGMTLRDYFAAMSMQAICSREVPPKSGDSNAHIAQLAYATADAMIAARGAA